MQVIWSKLQGQIPTPMVVLRLLPKFTYTFLTPVGKSSSRVKPWDGGMELVLRIADVVETDRLVVAVGTRSHWGTVLDLHSKLI